MSFLKTAKGTATATEMIQIEMMTARARHWVIRTRSGYRTAMKRSHAMAVRVSTLDVEHVTANSINVLFILSYLYYMLHRKLEDWVSILSYSVLVTIESNTLLQLVQFPFQLFDVADDSNDVIHLARTIVNNNIR